MNQNLSVLVVSKNPRDLAQAEVLRRRGYDVTIVHTGGEMRDALQEVLPDVALVSQELSDGHGSAYIAEAQILKLATCHRFVLLSEQKNPTGEGAICRPGFDDYVLLLRPHTTEELLDAIEKAQPPRRLSA
ncbi:MAG: hypothetical protein K0S38_698 [Candidatus Paceibacter sp.]|jgi:DNA-binding response OmpR family regulator|nr:hypothetical protein [Candidatus Paceibacter sp.]